MTLSALYRVDCSLVGELAAYSVRKSRRYSCSAGSDCGSLGNTSACSSPLHGSHHQVCEKEMNLDGVVYKSPLKTMLHSHRISMIIVTVDIIVA